LLDQIERTRTGWSSDFVKSAEWQKLKTDWAAAKGVAKDVLGLGALSGPDEALIENYLSGGIDPTSRHDLKPGLDRARMNMINMTRDDLETHGLDKGVFDIPKPKLDKPVETPSDRAFKAAQEKPTLTKVIDAEGSDYSKDATEEEMFTKYVAPGVAPTLDNVVLPQVRNEIDKLTTIAREDADAKKRDEALAKLQKLIEVGGNAGTQNAARAALEAIGRPATTYEDATGVRTQTARETVPPPKPPGAK
jgi:hypothetical protein